MQQKIKKVLFAEFDEAGQLVKETAISSPIPVIRNHFNSRYFFKNMEVNDEPSLTIPDQAMTVQELLTRFASGLPLSAGRVPIYEGEEEMTDLEKLDLAEREEILRSAREEIREITERVNKRKLDAQQRNLEEKVAARLKAEADKRAQFEALKKEFETNE